MDKKDIIEIMQIILLLSDEVKEEELNNFNEHNLVKANNIYLFLKTYK